MLRLQPTSGDIRRADLSQFQTVAATLASWQNRESSLHALACCDRALVNLYADMLHRSHSLSYGREVVTRGLFTREAGEHHRPQSVMPGCSSIERSVVHG